MFQIQLKTHRTEWAAWFWLSFFPGVLAGMRSGSCAREYAYKLEHSILHKIVGLSGRLWCVALTHCWCVWCLFRTCRYDTPTTRTRIYRMTKLLLSSDTHYRWLFGLNWNDFVGRFAFVVYFRAEWRKEHSCKTHARTHALPWMTHFCFWHLT